MLDCVYEGASLEVGRTSSVRDMPVLAPEPDYPIF